MVVAEDVEDLPAATRVSDQSGFAQDAQVLRNVGLEQPGRLHQLVNKAFLFAEQIDDRQSGRKPGPGTGHQLARTAPVTKHPYADAYIMLLAYQL
jgi:hypothetical protein